jgi:hypothetical protein
VLTGIPLRWLIHAAFNVYAPTAGIHAGQISTEYAIQQIVGYMSRLSYWLQASCFGGVLHTVSGNSKQQTCTMPPPQSVT